MKIDSIAAVLSCMLPPLVLACASGAIAQTGGSVVNLAGTNATCLNDPAQMANLQREQALLSRITRQPLSIIALPEEDAERLERKGTLQWCARCSNSVNLALACIGDASAINGSAPATARTNSESAVPRSSPSPNIYVDQLPENQPSAAGLDVDRQWREQAVALARSHQWAALQNLGNRWVQGNRSWAPAWFYRGLANEWLGNTRQAQSDYGQAVALNPRMMAAQFGLGRALVEEQQYQQGVAPLRLAVAAFPSNAHAWMNLGIALENTGQQSEGIEALVRAANLAPTDAYMAGAAGDAYLRHSNWSSAAPLLERAIQKQPFNEVNLNWMQELGGAYFKTGDYRRSSQVFEATLKFDSNDPNTWYYLWQSYAKLGDSARAEQAHQTLTRLSTPNRPTSQLCPAGTVHVGMGCTPIAVLVRQP